MQIISKSICLILCLTSLGTFFLGCGKEKQTKAGKIEKEQEISNLSVPEYTVLDEDVYDAPVKTQVTLKLLVSGEISKSGLTALLNDLYAKTRVRSGFKYHDHPTNIFINAYISKEHAESGMGQWVAMLAKSYDDKEPEISINEQQLKQLKARPEEKFGLPEEKSRLIFAEIVKAEDRAEKEADKKYPDLKPGEPGYSRAAGIEQMKRRGEFKDKLKNEYKDQLAKNYGLTREQLNQIGTEGVVKDWPFPKYTP